MNDACTECGAEIPRHVDRCVGCGCDVGFPNVRMASRTPEIEALVRRYQKAKRNAAQRGIEQRVNELEATLETSEAVMCKPWGILNTLLLRDSRLLQTFHQEVAGEGRLPESNEFDSARAGVDATFFPYYHEAIRFAALSIDGCGSTAYGGGCLVLKTMSIAARATVFEENTLTFVKRRKHPAGYPPPPGLTATWTSRAKLGIAKLAPRVDKDTSVTDFASLVLTQKGGTGDDDFLEVHIYGPIHRSAVARVSGTLPKNPVDRLLVFQLQKDLKTAGVSVALT